MARRDFEDRNDTRGFEEEDFNYPPPRSNRSRDRDKQDEEDPLWMNYSIRKGTPLRSTIEQLLLVDVNQQDIIELIAFRYPQQKEDSVKSIISEIINKWRNMGRTLSYDEKELERGRMKAALLRMKMQAEEAHQKGGNTLAVMLNIEDRLAKLSALDAVKGEVGTGMSEDESAFRRHLDDLPAESLAKLIGVLTR